MDLSRVDPLVASVAVGNPLKINDVVYKREELLFAELGRVEGGCKNVYFEDEQSLVAHITSVLNLDFNFSRKKQFTVSYCCTLM